jgi:hypothetical protein
MEREFSVQTVKHKSREAKKHTVFSRAYTVTGAGAGAIGKCHLVSIIR